MKNPYRNTCLAALALVFCGATLAEDKADGKVKRQTRCPVWGRKVSKRYYTDYAGSSVYFCSRRCKSKFDRNAAKYARKLAEKDVVLAEIPEEPPVVPATHSSTSTSQGGRTRYRACLPQTGEVFTLPNGQKVHFTQRALKYSSGYYGTTLGSGSSYLRVGRSYSRWRGLSRYSNGRRCK